MVPVGRFARWLTQRRVDRVFGACAHLLAATAVDGERLRRRYPRASIGRLERGIDLGRFDPALRDRAWLRETCGIAGETVVICFAGRIDRSKEALLAAQTVAALRESGPDVCLLAIGEGRETAAIRRLLGAAAILPGTVDQQILARLLAGSDLFLFPSRSETFGNVVLEARASGLPVIVPAGTATTELISRPDIDGIIVKKQSVEAYCKSVFPLVADTGRRRRMGQAARRDVETRSRTWDAVLAEDLLPAWRAVAGTGDRPAVWSTGDAVEGHAADTVI